MHFKCHVIVCLVFKVILFQQINAPNIVQIIANQNSIREKLIAELGIKRGIFDYYEADRRRRTVTNLERFRGLLPLTRHLLLNYALSDINRLYRNNLKNGKLQPFIAPNISFPCDLTNARSSQPPISIHRLRPGDIDVIACFGDSGSAGLGILSTNILHSLNEHRGHAFSCGGLGNWRNNLTLPNILKVFNPKLYGYATADGVAVDRTSHFNIAESMLLSRDLPYQASVLISRLRLDPVVDMRNHWKLLTIFIGTNDICSDLCHYDRIEDFFEQHESDLRRTLTILRDSVPRLLVNLVPAMNLMNMITSMKNRPLICAILHPFLCSCIPNMNTNNIDMKRISGYVERWQMIDKRVANLREFQTDDFAVVYQPFMANYLPPTLPNGNTDFRYFGIDCFHFSQLGHASLSNALWNNMLQPIGQKQTYIKDPYTEFSCPTKERPYIATKVISSNKDL